MTSRAAIQELQRQTETLSRAAADVEIRGAPLAIYVHLVNTELDSQEFRPVKVSALASTLRLKLPTAAQALQRLQQRGYIEIGPKIDRVKSYRLKFAA